MVQDDSNKVTAVVKRIPAARVKIRFIFIKIKATKIPLFLYICTLF